MLDVWVPHVLTERNLCRRIDVCDSLLKRHENDSFLKRIITGDEKGHLAKKMNRLKLFPKSIFTKKGDAVCLKLLGAVDTRRYYAWKTGSGAARKTTRREDRRNVRQALVDPTVTRSTIRADVGIAIVPQTISRHLAEANLKSKRPFRALSLTPEHQQLRLQWCQAR
ncbi:HTH_Tnp_Tc3_2 domain-containing protein [Trichonephila clavipes]|nr:HTH_Tnp_Tc3_2 domain-containing protein [Trichonephila clavipes]